MSPLPWSDHFQLYNGCVTNKENNDRNWLMEQLKRVFGVQVTLKGARSQSHWPPLGSDGKVHSNPEYETN